MTEQSRVPSVSRRQIATAAIVTSVVFVIAVLAQGVSNGVALWQRKQVLMTEIAARRAETTELEQRKQFAQTDDFVEIVARRELKMLRPGEVAVIPLLPVSAQPAIKDR